MHNKVPKNEYNGGKRPSSFRGNPYKKDRVVYDKKSELGYSDGSPYAALPYIDIYTPQGIIDMSNTGIPLTANGQYLPPYSGLHDLGTNVVREIPIPIFETKEDFYKDALRRKRDVYWDNDSSGSGVPFPTTNMPSRSTGVSMPSVNTGYQGIAMQYGGDPSIPELDQAKKGGWLNKYSKMPKKKSSKNIKTSINKLMTRNPLFERNYMLYGAKGPRLYDPTSKFQGGGAREPIYVSSPLDPRYIAYTDSLSLYNLSNRLARNAGYGFPSNFSFPRNPILYQDYNVPYSSTGTYTPPFASSPVPIGTTIGTKDYRQEVEKSLKRKIKPIGYTYDDIAIPVYIKPKERVVVDTPVSTTTPAPPAPVVTSAPTQPNTKYAYMPTNFGPVYYYEWDAQQKKWIPISQQAYNYNTKGGTENTQLYDSKPPGFKKGGWLDSYQDGGQNKPSASQEWIANNPGYLPSSMVPIIGEDGKTKQVRLDSPEYSNYWNKYSGKILQPYTVQPTEDNPEGIMYQAPTIEEKVISEKATGSGAYVKDFEKKEGTLEEWKAKQKETAWDRTMKNMKNVSYEDYLNQRDARLTSMYEDKKNNYVAGKILKNKPKGDKSRAEWNQSFTPAEKYFIDNSNKANKIKPNLFQTTLAGAARLSPIFQAPGLAGAVDKTIGLTPEESKNISPLNTLDILSYPTNLAWGALYDPEMSFGDALSGQQTDKIPLGMQIAGDPLNLLGVGLVDEGADVLRGINKAGEYLTTQTPLKNTWRYNPWRFKENPEAYYHRSPNLENIINKEKGTIQGWAQSEAGKLYNETSGFRPGSGINIKKSADSEMYFAKGTPLDWGRTNMVLDEKTGKLKPGQGYPGPYIVEVSDVPFIAKANRKFTKIRDPKTGEFVVGKLPPTAKGSYAVPAREVSLNEAKFYKEDWLRGYKEIPKPKRLPGSPNIVKSGIPNPTPVSSSVDDVGKAVNTSQPWQMKELPGLHLKSTMEGEAISKIVEPKTGLINTEQALAIIGKESGGADKVALIRQGLGDKSPKKMDFNKFRKVVQDQLIPLERQFANHSSNYGIGRLGYLSSKRSSYDISIQTTKDAIARGENVAENQIHLKKLLDDYNQLPLENQTLLLSNKNKFGRGSSAHGNPDETLGHIHFLRDSETPDILTVTQIQSDAFQGTHRIMPKTFDKEQQLRSLAGMEDVLKRRELDYAKAKKLPNGDYKFEDGLVMDKTLYEQGLSSQREMNAMKKAEIENFTQKQLLDKNHQERYLQELVDYAGKRGDVNKIRVPTSETAAKVQGYKPVTTAEEIIEKHNKLKGTPEWNEIMANTPDADKVRLQKVLEGKIKGDIYDLERTTILKKYAEQPKTIKKLFGKEPTIVTDSKGNTWYEFDIPDKFKKGKGEIKAFGLAPFIGIGGAGALGALQKKKQGGWLDTYQNRK